MAHIIFYTKPGCRGGIRQKLLLMASEHTVEERSILAVAWTPETLRPFLNQLPTSEWYNPNAPDVKSGKILPGVLPVQETLELFCREPILIKRPLMQIGSNNIMGFNIEELQQMISLKNIPEEDLNTCQRKINNEDCSAK